jgi:magnesium-transporting ATPase (P-type)
MPAIFFSYSNARTLNKKKRSKLTHTQSGERKKKEMKNTFMIFIVFPFFSYTCVLKVGGGREKGEECRTITHTHRKNTHIELFSCTKFFLLLLFFSHLFFFLNSHTLRNTRVLSYFLTVERIVILKKKWRGKKRRV